MLQRLLLENFTAFHKLDMEFSQGINLFIGDNGTGKTHILKLLYTALSAISEDKHISDKLLDVFLPKDRNIRRLIHRKQGSIKAKVHIYKDHQLMSFRFVTSNIKKLTVRTQREWRVNSPENSVYIPVKEMLANAPGFLSLYKDRDIHFEEIYADIIYKALLPKLREPISQDRKKLLDSIQNIIEGKITLENDSFYLKSIPLKKSLEFTLLAEGIRKFGLLWLLIQNGSIREGTGLFWDEPETNLNPSMLRPLVEILLQLQRIGVQIFIATHNDVLLSEFDLQKTKKDEVRFFALNRDEDTKEIVHQSGENYIDIIPNKISDAYTAIYDAKIKESLGLK